MRWSLRLGVDQMYSFLNQIKRLYIDNGSGDRDFTEQKEKCELAQQELARSTRELAKAAENLNRAALSAGFPEGSVH